MDFLFVLVLRWDPWVHARQVLHRPIQRQPRLLFCTRVATSGCEFVSLDYDLGPATILGPVPQ